MGWKSLRFVLGEEKWVVDRRAGAGVVKGLEVERHDCHLLYTRGVAGK